MPIENNEDLARENIDSVRLLTEELAAQRRQLSALTNAFSRTLTDEQKRDASFQQAQHQVEGFGDALESTNPEIRAYAKTVDDQRKKLEALNETIEKTSAAFKDGFSKLISQSDRSFGKYNTAIEGMADGVAKLAGPYLGAFISAAGKVTTAMLSQYDAFLKTTDSLSKVGATVGMTTSEFRDLAHAAGVTSKNLEILAKPLKELGVDLTLLGSNSADGAREFAKLTAVSSEQRQSYQRLGVSQEELIKNQADYIALQGAMGRNMKGEIKDRATLQRETLEYTDRLVTLSALTGQDVDSIKQKQKQAADDLTFQISMYKLNRQIQEAKARGDTDEVARLSKQRDTQSKVLEQVSGLNNEIVTKGVRQMISTGTISGEESAALARMGLLEDVQRLGKVIKEGGDAEAASLKFQDEYNKKFNKTLDAVGTSVQFVNDIGKSYGVTKDTVKQANRDLEKSYQEQGKIVKGRIEEQKKEGFDTPKDARAKLTELEIAAGVAVDKFTGSIGMATIAILALGSASAFKAFTTGSIKESITSLGKILGDLGRGKIPGAMSTVPAAATGAAAPAAATATTAATAARTAATAPVSPLRAARLERVAAGRAAQAAAAAPSAAAAAAPAAGAGAATAAAKTALGSLSKLAAPLTAIVGVVDGIDTAASGISEANKELKEGKITAKEASVKKKEAIGAGTGTAAGTVAGAVIGQALIPIPVLGAAIGGAVGGWLGGKGGKAIGTIVGESVSDELKDDKKDKKEEAKDQLPKDQILKVSIVNPIPVPVSIIKGLEPLTKLSFVKSNIQDKPKPNLEITPMLAGAMLGPVGMLLGKGLTTLFDKQPKPPELDKPKVALEPAPNAELEKLKAERDKWAKQGPATDSAQSKLAHEKLLASLDKAIAAKGAGTLSQGKSVSTEEKSSKVETVAEARSAKPESTTDIELAKLKADRDAIAKRGPATDSAQSIKAHEKLLASLDKAIAAKGAGTLSQGKPVGTENDPVKVEIVKNAGDKKSIEALEKLSKPSVVAENKPEPNTKLQQLEEKRSSLEKQGPATDSAQSIKAHEKILASFDKAIEAEKSKGAKKEELKMHKASDGGSFSGPKEGYPVLLHGDEDVIPRKGNVEKKPLEPKEPTSLQALGALGRIAIDAPKQIAQDKVNNLTGSDTAGDIAGAVTEKVLKKAIPELGNLQKLVGLVEKAGAIESKTDAGDTEGAKEAMMDFVKSIPKVGGIIENVETLFSKQSSMAEKGLALITTINPAAGYLLKVGKTLFDQVSAYSKSNVETKSSGGKKSDDLEMPKMPELADMPKGDKEPLDIPKASKGGEFSGPESGYPVMLHGKEIVIPSATGTKVSELPNPSKMRDHSEDDDDNFATDALEKEKQAQLEKLNKGFQDTDAVLKKLIGSMTKLDKIQDDQIDDIEEQIDTMKNAPITLTGAFKNAALDLKNFASRMTTTTSSSSGSSSSASSGDTASRSAGSGGGSAGAGTGAGAGAGGGSAGKSSTSSSQEGNKGFFSSIGSMLGIGGSKETEPTSAAGNNVVNTKAPEGSTQELLDFIAKHESGGNYNILVGGKTANLIDMTVEQVLELQRQMRSMGHESSAVGKYQIINKTLLGTMGPAGVRPTDKFDQATQDKLGTTLLRNRGLDAYLNKKIDPDTFADNLSKEWASLPYRTGKSFYAGVGSNKSLTDRSEFISKLPKTSSVSAKEGAIIDGSESGYPIDLTAHGNEVIAPLDKSTLLGQLAKEPATESAKNMLAGNPVTNNNDTRQIDAIIQYMEKQQEMMELLSEKLDDMIEELEESNDTQGDLLKATRV
jgi:muramidase (phage lysozyme)